MKKLIFLAIVFAIAFISCQNDSTFYDVENHEKTETKNNYSKEYELFKSTLNGVKELPVEDQNLVNTFMIAKGGVSNKEMELIREIGKGLYRVYKNQGSVNLKRDLYNNNFSDRDIEYILKVKNRINKSINSDLDLNVVIPDLQNEIDNVELSKRTKNILKILLRTLRHYTNYFVYHKSHGKDEYAKACNPGDVLVDTIVGTLIASPIVGLVEINEYGYINSFSGTVAVSGVIAFGVSIINNCWVQILDLFAGIFGWSFDPSPDCNNINVTPVVEADDCNGSRIFVQVSGGGDDIISYSWTGNDIEDQNTTQPFANLEILSTNGIARFTVVAECSDGTEYSEEFSIDIEAEIENTNPSELVVVTETKTIGVGEQMTICVSNDGGKLNNTTWSTNSSAGSFNGQQAPDALALTTFCRTVFYWQPGQHTIEVCNTNQCSGEEDCVSTTIVVNP